LKKDSKEEFWLPKHELEALSECFLPAMKKFYEDPENMEAFRRWEAERYGSS